jgi:hypothetical protein
VSVDGTAEHHDTIRGHTYDRVMAHIAAAPRDNLCLYMAINRINLADIEQVARIADDLPTVRAVSFNLHTPYPGTGHRALTREQRREACTQIGRPIREGFPILNLASTLPAVAENAWPTPCHQCVIVEDGQQWVCGRCVEIPGLCQQCGYLFSAELSLLFRGRPRVVADAVRVMGATSELVSRVSSTRVSRLCAVVPVSGWGARGSVSLFRLGLISGAPPSVALTGGRRLGPHAAAC